MGWGTFLGKVAEQFQGRIERLKNEMARLIKEHDLIINSAMNESKALRVQKINKRIEEIDEILRNNAKD